LAFRGLENALKHTSDQKVLEGMIAIEIRKERAQIGNGFGDITAASLAYIDRSAHYL
jgi:hypothetical protein